jgi:hypothetical protein
MTDGRWIRQRTESGPTMFHTILDGPPFTGQIHFTLRENKNHIRLKIPQINIDFADCFQDQEPISLQADSGETKYDSVRAS